MEEFLTDWHDFAGRWARLRSEDADAAATMVDDALRTGLPARVGHGEASPEDVLRCGEAVVRASGLVDEAAYVAAAQVAYLDGDPARPAERARYEALVADPVHHYATEGWRQVRNPSLAFDGWCYTIEHLDVRRDVVDPLVHYALRGRFEGLAPMPTPATPPAPAAAVPGVRRICLFAGYDPDGIVDDHVVRYLTDLARFADVYYLADCVMRPGELQKLDGIVRGAWQVRHGRYDFGSFSMLARELVGWEVIDGYDELLLVNDSSYLVRPLDAVFATMDATPAHWWGLQLTARRFEGLPGDPAAPGIPLDEARARTPRAVIDYMDFPHVSSYFLAYRKPVMQDAGFRRLLSGVERDGTKTDVVLRYEIGISRYLTGRGYELATFVRELYPGLPVYSARVFDLIRHGFPLLKRQFLFTNPLEEAELHRWKEWLLDAVPDAPVELFERHLVRTTEPARLQHSLSVRRGPDGALVSAPYPRVTDFPDVEREVIKFPHWWGFVVDPDTGTLVGNVRAVYEEVARDPSLRAIVFSQGAVPLINGVAVEGYTDWTPEGLHHLARCGTMVVGKGPRIDLHQTPVPRMRNFVHVGAAMPGGASLEGRPVEVRGRDVLKGVRTVVTPRSGLETLRDEADRQELVSLKVLATGVPRHDFLVAPEERLPRDLADDLATVRRLVDEASGLPLALLAGGADGALAAAAYDEVLAWCRAHDHQLAVLDLPAAREWSLAYAAQDDADVLDLAGALTHTEAAVRAAHVVITPNAAVADAAQVVGAPCLLVGATEGGSGHRLRDRLAALAVDAPDRAAATAVDGADARNAWRLVRAVRQETHWRAPARVR